MIRLDATGLVSHSPDQTRFLGRLLGELALAGDIFLLVGDLGAGKTCLTQGIAIGLGIADHVRSPSFVLVREYQGRLPLYHMDFYRLESLAEVEALGLDSYLYGRGLTVVEWANRADGVLPFESLLLNFSHISESDRRIEIQARGGRYPEMLAGLTNILQSDKSWNWR
jgi:tRNA threonylcarbamoyladenosine biosynthesis protein TsaE